MPPMFALLLSRIVITIVGKYWLQICSTFGPCPDTKHWNNCIKTHGKATARCALGWGKNRLDESGPKVRDIKDQKAGYYSKIYFRREWIEQIQRLEKANKAQSLLNSEHLVFVRITGSSPLFLNFCYNKSHKKYCGCGLLSRHILHMRRSEYTVLTQSIIPD